MKSIKINRKSILYLFAFIYFISLTSFQLGYGMDPLLKKTCLGLFIIAFFVYFISEKVFIKKATIYILSFWIFYYLSILWANDKTDIFYYLNNSIYMIIISLMIPNMIEDENDIKILVKLVVLSLLVSSIILVIRTPLEDWGSIRVGTVLGLHPNELGVRMAFGVLLDIYIFHSIIENHEKKITIMNLIYLLSLIIFTLIAIFSQSKKAIIIMVLGVATFEILKSSGLKIFIKIVLVVLLGCIFMYMLMNNDFLYKTIGYRFEDFYLSLIGTPVEQTGDISTYERQFYIDKAFELFKNNPFFGFGGNNFTSYMRQIGYSHIAYSHNNYTELLATLGIFGTIIYYYPFCIMLIAFLKIRSSKDNNLIVVLFLSVLISKMIADFAMVSYISEFINLLFVIVVTYYEMKKKVVIVHEESSILR